MGAKWQVANCFSRVDCRKVLAGERLLQMGRRAKVSSCQVLARFLPAWDVNLPTKETTRRACLPGWLGPMAAHVAEGPQRPTIDYQDVKERAGPRIGR